MHATLRFTNDRSSCDIYSKVTPLMQLYLHLYLSMVRRTPCRVHQNGANYVSVAVYLKLVYSCAPLSVVPKPSRSPRVQQCAIVNRCGPPNAVINHFIMLPDLPTVFSSCMRPDRSQFADET